MGFTKERPNHPKRATFVVGALLAAMLSAGSLQAQDLSGDCDGNGQVSVDELVLGVTIALGMEPLDVCLAADGNGDGNVTVELSQGDSAGV